MTVTTCRFLLSCNREGNAGVFEHGEMVWAERGAEMLSRSRQIFYIAPNCVWHRITTITILLTVGQVVECPCRKVAAVGAGHCPPSTARF